MLYYVLRYSSTSCSRENLTTISCNNSLQLWVDIHTTCNKQTINQNMFGVWFSSVWIKLKAVFLITATYIVHTSINKNMKKGDSIIVIISEWHCKVSHALNAMTTHSKTVRLLSLNLQWYKKHVTLYEGTYRDFSFPTHWNMTNHNNLHKHRDADNYK